VRQLVHVATNNVPKPVPPGADMPPGEQARTCTGCHQPWRSVGDEISSSSPAGAVVSCRPGTDLDGIAVVRTVHPAWAR